MGCVAEARPLPPSLCDKVFLSGDQLSVRGWWVAAVAPAGHLPARSSPASLEEDLESTKASARCCLQRGSARCRWRACCPERGNGGPEGQALPELGAGRCLGREEGGASPPPHAAPAHVRSRARSIPGPRPRPRPPRPRPIAGGTAAPTPAARPALPPATSRPPALLCGAPDHRTRLRRGSLTPSPSYKLCRRAAAFKHTHRTRSFPCFKAGGGSHDFKKAEAPALASRAPRPPRAPSPAHTRCAPSPSSHGWLRTEGPSQAVLPGSQSPRVPGHLPPSPRGLFPLPCFSLPKHFEAFVQAQFKICDPAKPLPLPHPTPPPTHSEFLPLCTPSYLISLQRAPHQRLIYQVPISLPNRTQSAP